MDRVGYDNYDREYEKWNIGFGLELAFDSACGLRTATAQTLKGILVSGNVISLHLVADIEYLSHHLLTD
jgi:hypothetical protein